MGDLERFIGGHSGAWTLLDQRVRRVEKEGLTTLRPQELRELGSLYRRASADLVYAESMLQNAELVSYLNALVGAAYGAIYQKGRFTWDHVKRFFVSGLPSLVRKRFRAICASTLLCVAGAVGGGVAVGLDREAFYHMVPHDYWKLYGERPKDLRAERFGNITPDQGAAFSAQIFTNNIRVCFMAFALGISFGILSGVSILYNGILLGAIGANFHRWGMKLDFWSLIIPHGGIELSCIFIAGGAGFVLGAALLRPGRKTRADSAKEGARDAMLLAAGIAPFLVIAGLIEGVVTPMAAVGTWIKIALGVVTGVLFWAYLLWPRRERA